jgi:hypothetical protein
LIPAKALPKKFLDDRAGFGIMLGKVPIEQAKAGLRTHMTLMEEQLKANQDNGLGPYLLGTQEPQYVDLGGAYTALNWIQSMQRSVPEYLPLDSSKETPFPLVNKYMANLRSHIDEGKRTVGRPEKLDSKQVAKSITEQSAKVVEQYKSSSKKVDERDPIVQAGQLKHGDHVEVTPMDTGRIVSATFRGSCFASLISQSLQPQRGELVGFTTERVSLIIAAGPNASNAPFLAHFPRLNYKVQRCKDSKM